MHDCPKFSSIVGKITNGADEQTILDYLYNIESGNMGLNGVKKQINERNSELVEWIFELWR